MESILSALPWQTLTPAGMAILFAVSSAWLVLSGRLIPHTWVERRDGDHEAHTHYLEKALEEQRATIDSLVRQNAELTASGRLSVALLQSLQGPQSLLSTREPLPVNSSGSDDVPAIET